MNQHEIERFLSLLGLNVLALFLVAIGVWTFWKLRSWWREDANDAETEHEILARYREMNLRGELSDEEYRSIKSQMALRLGMASAAPRPTREVRPKVAEQVPATASKESQHEPPAADDQSAADN